jgi:hypothetical protein
MNLKHFTTYDMFINYVSKTINNCLRKEETANTDENTDENIDENTDENIDENIDETTDLALILNSSNENYVSKNIEMSDNDYNSNDSVNSDSSENINIENNNNRAIVKNRKRHQMNSCS